MQESIWWVCEAVKLQVQLTKDIRFVYASVDVGWEMKDVKLFGSVRPSSRLRESRPNSAGRAHQHPPRQHIGQPTHDCTTMGKNKRAKAGAASSSSKKHKGSRTLTRASGISKSKPVPKTPAKRTTQALHAKPTIPFCPSDAILLIGEGDLSFARSLIETHGCENVTATVLESEAELREKYPQVAENIAAVEDGGGSVRYGVDAGKMKPWTTGKGKGVGVMDRVIFNFPHVGGKSTDVNRQVRYNQGKRDVSLGRGY